MSLFTYRFSLPFCNSVFITAVTYSRPLDLYIRNAICTLANNSYGEIMKYLMNKDLSIYLQL